MVFLLNYLRQAVERQKVEREGRGEAQSDLLGTICIHREEELICAEGQSTYRICDMAPYRGRNNFSTLVPPFSELLVLDAREAWTCNLLSGNYQFGSDRPEKPLVPQMMGRCSHIRPRSVLS